MTPCAAAAGALTALLTLGAPVAAGRWEVRDGGAAALRAALESAAPGDTVVVHGGRYVGAFTVDRPVSLLGEGTPVLDGGGRGTVLHVVAPRVTVTGFEIRGSGDSLDQESSGIALDGATEARVVGNRIVDTLFGVYLRRSPGSVVRGNAVRGKELPLARRGDAIRVWYSDGVEIVDNRVEGSRDVVLWYSARLTVRGNRVADGRYGLHFMYCDDARIERNRLLDNSVGAFLMYSRRLHLNHNAIAGNHGPSGYGVGLKDMDDAVLADNLFVGNRVGAFLDNSPREIDSSIEVSGNLFAANDAGVTLLPNVRRGRFLDNSFVDNREQVAIAGGGGDPEANLWQSNYWSDYAGFDAAGDGTGDVPYRAERLFEELADRRPELRLFAASPATEALDYAARAFPLVRPQAKLVDSAPRMAPRPPAGVPPLRRPGAPRLVPIGAGMVASAVLLLFWPALRRGEGRGGRSTMQRPADRPSATAPRAHPAPVASAAALRPTAAAPPALVVRGLTKRFGGRLAVDGVSFTVASGESVAVWGPNGAGKTTVLRALLGVIPFEGSVEVAGCEPWVDGKAARRAVGFVPQDIGLQPDLAVAETLVLYARLRRVPAERPSRLLAELGLGGETEKRVGELSGGLRQRLALAVALLADPPILLLDEPTANLDARSRGDLMDLLLRLKGAGKTLVFSSHRPDEVLALADRVLHLDGGRLLADGPAAALLLDPSRRSALWILVEAARRGEAEQLLAAAGLAPRRVGAHLVVHAAAAEKVRPIELLLAAAIRILDFELEAPAGEPAVGRGPSA